MELSETPARGLGLIGVGTLVGIWFVAADILHVDPLLLPPLKDTVRRLYSLVASESLAIDLAYTLRRWLTGYALALVTGVPVGLLLGSSRRLYACSEFLLDFFRSLPVTALFPLFMLIWGVRGEESKLAMVYTACFFPIVLASIYGVRHSNPLRARMAQTFGATRAQIFRTITFFEAMPSVAVGARTALSGSLIVCILTEMFIGTDLGVGTRLFEAYSRSLPADLFAMILVLGLIGYSANQLFILIERRFLFWAGR